MRGKTGRQVVHEKIKAKYAQPRKPGARRSRIAVSKAGRLLEVEFSGSLADGEKCRGILEFSESEILFLAHLCRRDRSDDALLQAIDDAAGVICEVRRTRKTSTSRWKSLEEGDEL